MMELMEIIHWGRDLAEYRQMFALSDQDLERRILGCSDGPACFNAEMTALGHQVVSFDPLYGMPQAKVVAQIEHGIQVSRELSKARHDDLFSWNSAGYDDVEALAMRHEAAMAKFLDDFRREGAGQRYVAGGLPELPFDDDRFDLALCGHYLFLYDHILGYDHHLASVRELLRVAREVRLHPLIDLTPKRSAYVAPLVATLQNEGYRIDEIPLHGYQRFATGGTSTLRIIRPD